MTLRKFDDFTDAEIPMGEGIEVLVSLVDGSSKVSHYATWSNIPGRLLDGTVGGLQVKSVRISDLTAAIVSLPQMPTVEEQRAARA